MGSRDPNRVQKRHGERLTALEACMAQGQFHQALEYLRRLLGDPQLPTETRILAKAKEVEALLGLGRVTEAFACAEQIESLVVRHRLFRLREAVEGAINRAREARGA